MTSITRIPDTIGAQEAARLISLGYRVLRIRPGGKFPAVGRGVFGIDHPTYSCSPASFKPGYGLALLCGPTAAWPDDDLVCFDLDNGFDLEAVLGELPPTLTSKGGKHRWYRIPRSEKVGCLNDWFGTKKRKGDPALDVKSDGGYAVEYPTVNDRGVLVEWDPPGWRDPAVLPRAALDKLKAGRRTRRDPAGAAGTYHTQAVVLAQTAPAAVAGAGGHDALWNVALDLVRGLRIPKDEALAMLKEHYNPRCEPPWSEGELAHKVDDAFDHAQVPFGYLCVQSPEGGYLMTDKGFPKSCFENVCRYVRAAYPGLSYDVVACAAFDAGKRVDVQALSGHVRSGINMAIGLDPSKGMACDAIEHVAREKAFNRIQDALNALPRWDGRRRLDRWLVEALGAPDTEYVRAVGRAWLISAVARAYQPGCKADHLLLLEGGQGIGKSTALAIIGGTDGYKDLTFGSHDKDAMQDLRGAWVVEYAELTGLSKRDDEWLKAHISKSVDSYRKSHGYDSLDYPRTCVLAGTTNPQGDKRYLRDSENRRYWPVSCGAPPGTIKARLGWLTEARDQVLAEAIAAYRAGEIWYLDREVGQTAEQAARRERDPLEESVPEVVSDSDEVSVRMLRAHPSLARDLTGNAIQDGRRIAKVLRTLGFTERPGGRSIWSR